MPSDGLLNDLSRRDAAWLFAKALAAVGGHEFFSSWLNAAQVHNHNSSSTAPPEPDRWSSYSPKFFSPDEFKMLDAYTAILIPSDDTPGAREAHVGHFIDFVVFSAAEYAPETQAEWRKAMKWLADQKFGSLTPSQQLALIEQSSQPELDRKKKHDGFATYQLIKRSAIQAFYTSRAGLIDALEYKGLAYLSQFPACNHPEHQRT